MKSWARLAIPDIIDSLGDIRRPFLYDERICDIAIRALEAIDTPETKQAVLQWRATHQVNVPAQPSVDENGIPIEPEQRDILGELLKQLHDSDWNVQQEAAKSLRDYAHLLRGSTDSPFVARLQEALLDKSWVVRWATTEALAWIKDSSSVSAVARLVSDPNKNVRVSAVRALSEIGDLAAIPDVTRALSDKSSMVREAAAEALGNLCDVGSVPTLIATLNDPDLFVRIAAIDALGKIKHPSAGEPLVRMLHDADETTRCFAADALGKIGHVGAVPDLIMLLSDVTAPHWDKKNRVCDIAAYALNMIGTPEAARAISEWRRSQPLNS